MRVHSGGVAPWQPLALVLDLENYGLGVVFSSLLVFSSLHPPAPPSTGASIIHRQINNQGITSQAY